MYLDKLPVCVPSALLITGRNRAARARHGIGRLAEYQSRSARRNDHGVCLESTNLERTEIHCRQAAADLMIIKYKGKHFPALILFDLSGHFPFSNLIIERIEQLLSRGGTGKRSAVMKSSPKTTKVQ